MHDHLRDKIWRLAEPVAASEGVELIHVECLKMHSRWVFRIFLDKADGISLDDCTEVSNLLGDVLDVHDLSQGPYTLEVSSPGSDRPLSREQDFMKFKGRLAKIKTGLKIDGMKNFQGILMDCTEENGRQMIRVNVSNRIFSIPKDDIVKANLVDDAAVARK